MSWILRDFPCFLTVTERSTALPLELCPDEEKPPLSQTPADPPRIAFSFEDRAGNPILHRQTPLFIYTFSIEYP